MRKKNNLILNFILINIYCITLRLFPLKVPNIEPILPMQAFFNKKYTSVFLFLFGFTNILIVDLISFKIGPWTIITSTLFGLMPAIFKLSNKLGIYNNILLTIIGTLFFDITTCFIGPLLFCQSYSEAIIGQIPFTLIHLIGNITFCLILNIISIVCKEKFEKIINIKN